MNDLIGLENRALEQVIKIKIQNKILFLISQFCQKNVSTNT